MNNKGLILVEILVIITIIGILAGVLLVVSGPARKKAKDNRIESNMLQLQNAAERIYLDNGNYNKVSCDPAKSPEIANLCQDVAKQGSSLRLYPSSPANSYCAYAPLISSGNNFCIDSKGFTGNIKSYVSGCSWPPFSCLSCPDFDCDGGITIADINVILFCFGADFNIDPPLIPPGCTYCEPRRTDVNGDGVVQMDDVTRVASEFSRDCPTPPWCPNPCP